MTGDTCERCGAPTQLHTKPSLGQLRQEGIDRRVREVLGADYVDSSLRNANPFMRAFQDVTTTWCWGYVWDRPGLERAGVCLEVGGGDDHRAV